MICDDILDDICAWYERFVDCELVIADDFNVDLDNVADACARNICQFLRTANLSRCDELFSLQSVPTYVNIGMNHESHIDYIVTSSPVSVKNFAVLDPSLNFSDHLPLTATISCTVTPAKVKCPSNKNKNKSYDQPRLRWDRADKVGYYNFTAACFPDILVKLRDFAVSSVSLGCDQTVSA